MRQTVVENVLPMVASLAGSSASRARQSFRTTGLRTSAWLSRRVAKGAQVVDIDLNSSTQSSHLSHETKGFPLFRARKCLFVVLAQDGTICRSLVKSASSPASPASDRLLEAERSHVKVDLYRSESPAVRYPDRPRGGGSARCKFQITSRSVVLLSAIRPLPRCTRSGEVAH